LTSGDTFFDSIASNPPHLWIVVAMLDAGEVLAFNLTSHRVGCDETCIVEPTDHPCGDVKHKSVIAYRYGQLYDASQIDMSIRARVLKMRTRVSTVLLERVQRGALNSEHTKRYYKNILVSQGVRRVAVVTKAKSAS
jgi:hypothetical protein